MKTLKPKPSKAKKVERGTPVEVVIGGEVLEIVVEVVKEEYSGPTHVVENKVVPQKDTRGIVT